MELDFDKEIDALLRKGAREPAMAGSPKSAHLEADEIAAFAENALPETAKVFYTKHLAACDRCRNILAQTISLYSEAETGAASSAVTTGAVSDIQIPWYRRLFAVPNLAVITGTPVLILVCLLGYLIVQRNAEPGYSDISKLSKSEQSANSISPASAPVVSDASNTAENANTSANTASPGITSGSSPLAKTLGQEDPNQTTPGYDQPSDAEKNERLRGAEPVPPASAPLVKELEPKTEVDDRKLAEKKRESKSDSSPSKVATDAISDSSATLSKDGQIQNNQIQSNAVGGAVKSKSGPYRDLQRNTTSNTASRADEDSSGRRAGGKSFEKKNGVWYDSAYRGQSTINISRGTSEYRSLDSGLRSIAGSLDGIVVVVWKEKAYRIQ